MSLNHIPLYFDFNKIISEDITATLKFLNHFIRKSLKNDLKNTLATSLENNRDYKDAREYYIELISIFLNHVEDNREMYRLILLNNKNSIVMDIVYDVLDNDIKKHIYEFDKNNKSVPIDIVTKFYFNGNFL